MTGRSILWAGTLRKGPIRERIDAAAGAGFDAIAWSLDDVADIATDPAGQRALRDYAEAKGVSLAVLDALFAWYPFDPPARHYNQPVLATDEALELAAALGASDVSALALVAVEGGPRLYADRLGQLADRAAGHGLRVALEFTPFPPVAGLGQGWSIVREADRPNLGMVFDCWHFYRCGNAEFELLEQLPGDRIFAVQMCDGGPIVESIIKDTYRHRRAPLEGDFDVRRIWATLRRIGGLEGLVGPEILSLEAHAMAPGAGAIWAAEAMARLDQGAGA